MQLAYFIALRFLQIAKIKSTSKLQISNYTEFFGNYKYLYYYTKFLYRF